MAKKLFITIYSLLWISLSILIMPIAYCQDTGEAVYTLEDFLLVNQMTQESVNYNHVEDIIKDNYERLQQITVAIVDSGFDITHPDLKGNIVDGYNFVDDSYEMYDDSGHGTLLAGIITGKHTGLAHGVKIMPIKVLDKYGFGRSENLVKGILWAVDHGADIINISMGRNKNVMNGEIIVSNTFSDIEYRAIEYALMNNVTVVLPSGNFRMDELSYPAAYTFKQTVPAPIIVSGFDNDEKYFWSNTSNRIDISAPAENILSIIPKKLDTYSTDYVNIENDGYSFCGGTSFSCAYISAMAAIIKAFDYELTNEQIRQIIISSTKDIGKQGKDDEFGYGKLDMRKGLFMQRLAAEPNIVELVEGEHVVFKVQLTDMENLTVAAAKKYLDFDDDMIIIEEDEIDDLDEIIRQKEREKEEEAAFETDIHLDIYRYYSYQDVFILEDNLHFIMEKPKQDCGITLETSGIYKVVFSSPTDLWVPFSYYLKVSPQNPTASLEEGLYFGERQLDFLVDTNEADIYYTTDGNPIIYNDEINPLAEKYEDSLYIKESQKVSTVSVKNGVISDVTTLEYRVVGYHVIVLILLLLVAVGFISAKKIKMKVIKLKNK